MFCFFEVGTADEQHNAAADEEQDHGENAEAGLAGDAGLAPASLPQALILCLVSPVSEELVYRGLVLRRCRQIIPLWASVVLSALLFAAAHGSAIRIALAFLSGLVWGVLACRTKTVRCSCLSHAAANTLSLVILLLQTR